MIKNNFVANNTCNNLGPITFLQNNQQDINNNNNYNCGSDISNVNLKNNRNISRSIDYDSHLYDSKTHLSSLYNGEVNSKCNNNKYKDLSIERINKYNGISLNINSNSNKLKTISTSQSPKGQLSKRSKIKSTIFGFCKVNSSQVDMTKTNYTNNYQSEINKKNLNSNKIKDKTKSKLI